MSRSISMSAAEYRAYVAARAGKGRGKAKGGGRNKYGAAAAFRCASCGGEAIDRETPCPACRGTDILRFDSGAEAKYWDRLRERERAGLVAEIERQVRFPIVIEGKRITTWRCDFRFLDLTDGRRRVIDVKGHDTDASRLRRRAVEAQHGISIEVVKR